MVDFFTGYVCSCRSGKKQVGCCVHIATVIYYLSYAKFRQCALRFPSQLLSTILCDMKTDIPNAPRYVRRKRNIKVGSSN